MHRLNLFPHGADFCIRDFGRGLKTLSRVQHELDYIGWSGNDIYVYEFKLYEATELPKEMILAFYHKVLDFYLGNVDYFTGLRVHLFLSTRCTPIDNSIRMLCFSFGIVLIDTELYPPPMIEYYAEYMLSQLIHKFPKKAHKDYENLVRLSRVLVRDSFFSLSDSFKLDSRKQIVFTPYVLSPDSLVRRHREINSKFVSLKKSFEKRR